MPNKIENPATILFTFKFLSLLNATPETARTQARLALRFYLETNGNGRN